MKVCNLEPISTVEDTIRVCDFIRNESSCIVIMPAFSWIGGIFREISIHLFHAENEEADQCLKALEYRCSDFTKALITDENYRKAADKELKERFNHVRNLTEGPLSLADDREILASGEYISSTILTYYLKSHQVNTVLLDAAGFMQLGSNGKLDLSETTHQAETITKSVQAPILVMQARLCKNAYGEIVQVSAQDSDYYAMIACAAFHATELVEWTHIAGFYTDDSSQLLPDKHAHQLTFDEAESFISAGISLVNPETIELARQMNIAIRLMDRKEITKERLYIANTERKEGVKAVVTRESAVFVRFHSKNLLPAFQFLEKTFAVLATYKVPVHMVTSSNVSVSMAAKGSHDTFRLIARELSEFADTVIEENVSTVSVLGKFDWDESGLEARIIDILKDIPIMMISYGCDNDCVSVVVRGSDREKTLCLLSNAFLNTDFQEDFAHQLRKGHCSFII